MADPAPFSNVSTPDEIAQRRRMAQLLMQQGMDTSPVGHWTQALARAVQGGVGGWQQGQANQAQNDRNSAVMQALAGDSNFGKLSPGVQGIMSQDPDLMRSAMSKVIGNQLDPNAGLRTEMLKTQIAHMKQQGATEAQIAPYKLQLMKAQTELAQANAKAAGQKDEINGVIAGILRGAQSSQPQQQPANPIQPQSFEGQPGADPNLIRTQAADMGPQPQAPAPQLIDTPMGRMPLEQARKLGFALALGGKGDAGKLLTDAANADALGKTAQGEVQKDLVGLVGTIGRLESISNRFDPKFLNIPERAGFAWTALQDKFGTLPEDQKKDLAKYTKFRQTSVQNAALYVKYLSGVAVSEQEFKRIMTTLPNAGTGIFDGDSPTEFKAKMGEATTQAKMAYARAYYLNQKGFKGKPWEAGIALDDVRGIIDERGAQLEQQLQGRVQPDRMRSTVRQKLKQEFGI